MIDPVAAHVVVEVAERYYLREQTQAEVARALGISRPRVSRLLKQGRETGIVAISIRAPFDRPADLEREFEARFNLRDVIIVPESENPLTRVAQAAAEYVRSKIKAGTALGVSWGRTVRQVADLLPLGGGDAVEVVPLVGGMGPVGSEIHANEIARQAAARLGCRYYVMSAPALTQSSSSHAALVRDRTVRGILMKARRVQLALVGIGGIVADSTLVRAGYLSADDLRGLRRDGAVGDICSRYFCVDGKPSEARIARRVVGIELTALRQIPLVIGAAAGKEKTAAIAGALRGRYVDVLVTDVPTARSVLRLAVPSRPGRRDAATPGDSLPRPATLRG
ncbi:MAG: sugar-binding transcriptional regulator [Candidatus Rokuibacteriota bacterium]